MKVSEETANAWLNGLFSDGAWLDMHTGDPGPAGISHNDGATRVFVEFYAASAGSISNKPADGVVPSGDMTWTHFSLHSGVMDSELKWKDILLTNVPVKSGVMVPLEAGALVLSIG